MSVLFAGVAFAASAAAAPADAVALHAKLVQEGAQVAAALAGAEAARDALDKEELALNASDAKLQKEVERANAAVGVYAEAAKRHSAAIEAHNTACAAPPPLPPQPEKPAKGASRADVEKFNAAAAEWKARAEAEQHAFADKCNAAGAALDLKSREIDAEKTRLDVAHAELDRRVRAQNAAAAAFDAKLPKAAEAVSAAEERADAWLARLNAVLGSPAFVARAKGVKECAARREMAVSGKDLQVLVGYHKSCAARLAN